MKFFEKTSAAPGRRQSDFTLIELLVVIAIIAVLAAMLLLNYALTLMVLCFVPFIVLFTIIFRKFLRRAYRKVKDATTDINTYLSENLSGMKITQIFNREEKEIPSTVIGEILMDKLKDLDSVAYVRFASVYREFKDVNTFMNELKKMLG